MTETNSTKNLAHETLNLAEVAGMSIGGIAPTVSVALTTSLIAGYAGFASPAAFVLAMIGAFCLAYVFTLFARRHVSPGVAFTYLREVFGRHAGFLGGWVESGSYMVAVPVLAGIAATSLTAIAQTYGASVNWLIPFIVIVLASMVANMIGVRISARILAVAEIISILVITAFLIVVVAKGGANGLSWEPFNPSSAPSGLGKFGFGLVFGFTFFAGFESSAALSAEAKNPRRAIPTAMFSAIAICGIFVIFSAYATAVGYGKSHVAAWAASGAPLGDVVGKYMGTSAATTVNVMVAVSGFAGAMSLLSLSSRVAFDMGQHGTLPSRLGYVHPRFRTPIVSLAVLTAIGLALGIGVGAASSPGEMIGIIAGTNTLGYIVVYVAVGFAAVFTFLMKSTVAWIGRAWALSTWRGVLFAIALVLLGFAFYSSVIPSPPMPEKLEPVFIAAWVAIGVGILIAISRRSAQPVGDLGEQSGSDAAHAVPGPRA